MPRNENLETSGLVRLQEDVARLKTDLDTASASLQAERRLVSELREDLRSTQEARDGLEARMRQADKFEMMYLDVVDREAKIQLLLAEAEERTQVRFCKSYVVRLEWIYFVFIRLFCK